jgi:hypothetical protein
MVIFLRFFRRPTQLIEEGRGIMDWVLAFWYKTLGLFQVSLVWTATENETLPSLFANTSVVVIGTPQLWQGLLLLLLGVMSVRHGLARTLPPSLLLLKWFSAATCSCIIIIIIGSC